MPANPALEVLGLPAGARVLVTHLDDVGMNLGSIDAWERLCRSEALASASVMMPCSWAPEALGRANAVAGEAGDAPDLGVHLTLTCEWDAFRWGPFGPGRRDLLCDSEGYLPRNAGEHFRITGTPAGRRAVAEELRAQLDGALARFPDISHVDSHMFALLYPPNLELYMELALDYRLPAMIPGPPEAWRPWCGSDAEAEALSRAAEPARRAGMPLFDRVCGVPLKDGAPADRTAATRRLIAECIPGLNFLFFHANTDSRELRTIARDAEARIGDLEAFSDPTLPDFIREEGIVLMGMRELREVMRG